MPMNRSDLVSALLAATGDLKPTGGSTNAELDDLRRALLNSFDTVPPPSAASPSPAPPALAAELNYLVAQHASSPAAPVRVAQRESPLRIGEAVAPTRVFGPFANAADAPVWFDQFTLVKQLHVRRGAAGEDLLLLPAETPRPGLHLGAQVNITIPAGSVWIVASLFSASAPAGSWAGMRIQGGTLTVRTHDPIASDVLTLDPTENATLSVTLDRPATAGPASGPGAQATVTTATLPATVTFVIPPSGHLTVTAGDASFHAYSNSFALTHSAAAPSYDADLHQVLAPLSPSTHDWTTADVRSDLLIPAGSAHVTRAAWTLPVTTAAPAGEAAGAGYLLVTLGPGVRAQWQGLDGGPAGLNLVNVLADGATLLFQGVASALRASQTFDLWNDSTLEIRFGKPFAMWFFSSRTGFDALQAVGTAQPHLDRPLASDGGRIDNPIDVTYALLEQPTGKELFLASNQTPDNARGPIALALTNALLTTTRIRQISLHGPLASPVRIDNGVLNLYFGLYQILPTLPDPYAANFEPILDRDTPDAAAAVHVQIAWPAPDAATMTVELTSATGTYTTVLPPTPPPSRTNSLFGRFSSWLGQFPAGGMTLLDVSTNADQLGVNFLLTDRANPPLTVEGLSLSTAALNVRSFLLPQFQWEPVTNVFNPRVGDPAGVWPSKDDGSPALVGANSVRLVPIAPIPVASEVVRAYQEGDATAALFTLPFGIEAVALLNRIDPSYLTPPHLELLQPALDGLAGAREISLRAGTAPGLNPFAPIATTRLLIAGAASQSDHLAGPPAKDTSVLGILQSSFNGSFGNNLPLSRIDLGGYGANVFSRWVNEAADAASITQVTFDAFHGRTAYERIQMVSILWPCQATMVRTITIERYGSGAVVRWDSGWIATTPGLFWRSDTKKTVFHPGAVRGMYNIREVRDTDQVINLVGDFPVQAVYFDADIEIEGAFRGQDGNKRVPARRQLGYIQQIPLDAGVKGVPPLDTKALNQLFAIVGPIGGPIDCGINLGSSKHQIAITGLYAQPAPPTAFAVALQGSPALKGAGHWSVARVNNATQTVEPLAADAAVPVIREGPAQAGPGMKPLRLADPADLFAPAPANDYALLFANHSQRILYARPKVEFADANFTSDLQPVLADPYAMLRAGGLFPKVSDAIPFGARYPLSNASGALRFVPDAVKFTAAPGLNTRDLVDGIKWNAGLSYNGPFAIDTANNWRVAIQGVSQKLSFDTPGEIMTVVHNVLSPTDDVESFPLPSVVLSPALSAATQILSLLQNLEPAADFAGLPNPLQVTASFSGAVFRLSVLADFAVQGEDGEPVDCGFGKLKGELQLGANLSAEVLKSKYSGNVFLSITGSYQQEVFPFIYGGGQLTFRISADDTGATTVELDACTMGSVGGTVIPFLMDLEATVKYGYVIQLDSGTFQPGIILGMDGRAKLLSGLLGFSFGVEGRLQVQRLSLPADPSVTVRGDMLVSGSVTVAWAIHERKSFHAQYTQKLDWKFFLAAGAGFIPIP
jgi:hypothetical protein